jgi:hypothetical protein
MNEKGAIFKLLSCFLDVISKALGVIEVALFPRYLK